MGNKSSKPMKPGSECAEWEHHYQQSSIYGSTSSNQSSSRKRKTNDSVYVVDESKINSSVAEKENHISMGPAYNLTDTSAIENGDNTRDRKHIDTLFAHQLTEDKGQSGVRRKSKKQHSTAHVDKTKSKTRNVLSVDEKRNDHFSGDKRNGIAHTISSYNVVDSPMPTFSAIKAPEVKHLKDANHDKNASGMHIDDICSTNSRASTNSHIDFCTSLATTVRTGLAKSIESRCQSKGELMTKSYSELPMPSLIQQASATGSVCSSCNSSSSAVFSTNGEVQNASQTSYRLTVTNVSAVLTSNASLFRSSILTQPTVTASKFGNFSYSGNTTSSNNTTLSPPTNNPTPSLLSNDGNFSMNTGAPTTDTNSSSVPKGYLLSQQPNSYHTYRQPTSLNNSHACASAGSITNQLSFVSSNSTPRSSLFASSQSTSNMNIVPDANVSNTLSKTPSDYYRTSSNGSTASTLFTSIASYTSALNTSTNTASDNFRSSPNGLTVSTSSFNDDTSGSMSYTANTYSRSNTNTAATSTDSLAIDTNTSHFLSTMIHNEVRNNSNEEQRNRSGLDYEVEEDAMDHYNAEGSSFQSQRSDNSDSSNSGRNSRMDSDFIIIRTSVGDTLTQLSARNITLNSNLMDTELTDENMGIILERPKYPRYATLASRQKSFENIWPKTNKMGWEKLPEAGFVYTGTADCVRCYYCNGGLREWLQNDCPWTEHARYYPHCPHVRHNKGDEFVRRVRAGADDGPLAQDGGSDHEMDIEYGADGASLSRDQEAIRIAGEIISDQTLLEKAAYYIKTVQGKSSFDAQQLAAIAFEIEEGTIVFNFEDAFEDDHNDHSNDIVDEVLTESVSSDDEDEIEIDSGVLEEENRMLRDRSLCKVCLDATACVLFLECGHMIACAMCAPALKTCAVCRAEVIGTVRAKYATDR